MSPPTQNPNSTSHNSDNYGSLAPPSPPSPDIKAPDAAAFEFPYHIRLTQPAKLKTDKATLLAAIDNLGTRIAALKENNTEPPLSRGARRSELSRAHIDLRKAKRALRSFLGKQREAFKLIDGAPRKAASRRSRLGLDARQQTEVTESAEEVEPAERAQEKAAEDAGQEGTTFVFRPKPESRS
jgi:hypothetical protein